MMKSPEESILVNVAQKKEIHELRQELSLTRPEQTNLVEMRDRILKTLTYGKRKVATTSPQYKTAAVALDKFILALRESALLVYTHP